MRRWLVWMDDGAFLGFAGGGPADPQPAWLQTGAHVLLGLACWAIGALLLLGRRRGWLDRMPAAVFSLFALACGASQLIEACAAWLPLANLDLAVLTVTAALALGVLGALWRSPRLAPGAPGLRQILAQAPIGLAVTALDGRFLEVNEALCATLGHTAAELLALGLPAITHPQDRAEDAGRASELIAGKRAAYRAELRVLHRSGAVLAAQLDVRLLRKAAGRPLQFVVQLQDVTSRGSANEALRQNHARLQQSLADLVRRNCEITTLSELSAILQSCGTFDEIVVPIRTLSGDLFPGYAGVLYLLHASRNYLEPVASWGTVAGTAAVFAPDACWALRLGEARWLDTRDGLRCKHLDTAERQATLCTPMLVQGETLGLLLLRSETLAQAQVDAEARREVEQLAAMTADRVGIAIANLRLRETLRQQSVRDPLTGLFNRRYLEETLPREASRAEREEAPLAVLMIDVDHFKSFNDSYGHEAGDEALRQIGRALQQLCRGSDLACRYGGEEFAVVLGRADLAQGIAKAEQIRAEIGRLELSGARLLRPVTISVGVAACPDDGCSARCLLDAADKALYRAKHAGRDRVVGSGDG